LEIIRRWWIRIVQNSGRVKCYQTPAEKLETRRRGRRSRRRRRRRNNIEYDIMGHHDGHGCKYSPEPI